MDWIDCANAGTRQSRLMLSVCGQGSPRGGPSGTRIDAEVLNIVLVGQTASRSKRSEDRRKKQSFAQNSSCRVTSQPGTAGAHYPKLYAFVVRNIQTKSQRKASLSATHILLDCMCISSKTRDDCLIRFNSDRTLHVCSPKTHIMCFAHGRLSLCVSCLFVCFPNGNKLRIT